MAALKTTMTITNVSGGVLAGDDSYYSGMVPPAIDGARKVNPLPFPASHVRNLANGASVVVKCNLTDLVAKQNPWDANAPIVDWDHMVQAHMVTIAYAADAVDAGVEVGIHS
jgi:hypothetical protein